jgi:hypothetical protein
VERERTKAGEYATRSEPDPHPTHRSGDYLVCRTCGAKSYEPLTRSDPAPLDVERLGFADLLTIGEALLEHYPPDTIVCSHSHKADIGAQTAAGVADIIASCRAAVMPLSQASRDSIDFRERVLADPTARLAREADR